MRKTNYNYFVVEECVDNSVITIEACYDGIWYEKAFFWGISIKEAIKNYRERYNLKYKRMHIEKHTYSLDPDLIMCY